MSDSMESWQGEGVGARGADILDLDRYVRGGRVEPTTPSAHAHRPQQAQLVVDAGAIGRGPSPDSAPSLTSVHSERSKSVHERPKRFSHDSGVSDDSYRRRRPQRHRSAKPGRVAEVAPTRPTRLQRDAGSSESRRAFRAQCEQMLREQQEQIAKVAQICERLTSTHPPRADVVVQRAETTLARERGVRDPPPPPSSDTSDLSSSSRDTKDLRRREKDKHRTDECKAYKIIMTKLDELNRLFAAKTLAERQVNRTMPRRVLRKTSSISVSDKVVATDQGVGARTIAANMQADVDTPAGSLTSSSETSVFDSDIVRSTVDDTSPPLTSSSRCPQSRQPDHGMGDSTRRSSRRALLRDLNAAPRVQGDANDRGENGYTSNNDRGPNSIDLEDPLQLYVQAKRLKSLRTDSHHCSASKTYGLGGAPTESMCTTLARYWRALRQCLVAHFCPELPC